MPASYIIIVRFMHIILIYFYKKVFVKNFILKNYVMAA